MPKGMKVTRGPLVDAPGFAIWMRYDACGVRAPDEWADPRHLRSKFDHRQKRSFLAPGACLPGEPTCRKRVKNTRDAIAESRMITPLIVDLDYSVIEGHHRLAAALELGVESVPVVRIVPGPCPSDAEIYGEDEEAAT